MSDPSIDVSGAGVNRGMQSSQAAAAMLQAYTNTVSMTPDIKLPAQVDKDSRSTVVEDLPAHQATARANATDYLDNINPLLVSTLAAIIAYANQQQAENARLYSLAQNLGTGDNAAQFTAGINILIKKCNQALDPNTGAVVLAKNALNAFLPLVMADQRNFSGDLLNAQTALTGEQGEMDQLKDKIAADNKAMNKDVGIIAGGATGVIVGGLMVVVGVVAEIETAGVSTALVVGGLAGSGTGTAAVAVASKDYAQKKQDYQQAVVQLCQDKQAWALVNQATITIGNLIDAVNQGITAVEGLQAGVDSLKSDLEALVDSLGDATTDNTWLLETLQAGNEQWGQTLAVAKSLQLNGTLPVQSDVKQAA